MTRPVDQLIDTLAESLPPVRRLWPPWLRAGLWLLAAGATAVLHDGGAGVQTAALRLGAAADLGAAAAASILTAILAALAACLVSLPDRSPAWAYLPLPGIILWATASLVGCLRYTVPGMPIATGWNALGCAGEVIGFSIPFGALLLLPLRRAWPLRQKLVATLAGLASAAAALGTLCLTHPYDAGVTDVTIHVLAVSGVMITLRQMAPLLLGAPTNKI